MNTRGLMELVVLGIGYEMKILPPTIYAVLVLMTVITTVMTMPMVHLINVFIRMKERKRDRIETIDKQAGAKVLLSFGRPSSGATLLHLTNQLLRRGGAHPQCDGPAHPLPTRISIPSRRISSIKTASAPSSVLPKSWSSLSRPTIS